MIRIKIIKEVKERMTRKVKDKKYTAGYIPSLPKRWIGKKVLIDDMEKD